jgi:hypothetical protein
MLLQSTHLRGRHAARAMNFLSCLHMNRSELMAIASRFPPTWKRLRRHAILKALAREIHLRAQLARAAAEAETRGSPSVDHDFYKSFKRGPSPTTAGAPKALAERHVFETMLWNATTLPTEQARASPAHTPHSCTHLLYHLSAVRGLTTHRCEAGALLHSHRP